MLIIISTARALSTHKAKGRYIFKLIGKVNFEPVLKHLLTPKERIDKN